MLSEDQLLMDKAAQAAGYHYAWKKGDKGDLEIWIEDAGAPAGERQWFPVQQQCDAMGLLIDLGISLYFEKRLNLATLSHPSAKSVRVDLGQTPHAAIRWAILRFAASLAAQK